MTKMFHAGPFLAAGLLLMSGLNRPAHGQSAAPDGAIVARRGDVQVTAADLKIALNALDPGARAQVTASPQTLGVFIRDRVLNLSVLAEAKAKNWDTRAEVARKIAETRDGIIVQSYLASTVPPDPAFPSDAEVSSAYETNKARLMVPRQFHIAQIVLLVKQGASPAEDEDAHKKAIELRAQVTKPKADFGEIAKKSSQEPASAEKGGEVGWLRENDLLAPAHDAVLTLQENGISQPFRMPDGWHVIKLLETRPASALPLADAKPQLVQALRQARAQQLMRSYLDGMLKTQPIELNEIEMSKAAGEVK